MAGNQFQLDDLALNPDAVKSWLVYQRRVEVEASLIFLDRDWT